MIVKVIRDLYLITELKIYLKLTLVDPWLSNYYMGQSGTQEGWTCKFLHANDETMSGYILAQTALSSDTPISSGNFTHKASRRVPFL